MHPTGHEILALGILGAIAFWLLRLYFQPMRPCQRCGGTGKNLVTRMFGGGKTRREGPCGKCGGSGKRWVRGARRVHRAVGSKLAANGKKERFR